MDQTALIAQQDALRPLRYFVGGLSGALAGYDQAVAGQDGWSWNQTGQYQSIGPFGVAIEGTPIATTRGGGLVISPMLVMIGIGAAAVLLMKG